MIIPLVLAVVSASVIVFLAGYRLAQHHFKTDLIKTIKLVQQDNETDTPIHAAIDREWKYTEELNRPFTDGK
jgi:hypothetical protein